MRADTLKSLSSETFDLLVVGGGIHGVAAAWEASRLGLKTALIEAGDFGGATSANSLKVIHGGFRYLQHGNLKRMRESIVARRRFLALAPELVKPQAFAIPTCGSGVRGRTALRIALTINDWISADRNAGLRQDRRLPRGRLLSRAEAAALWPTLPSDAFDGGAFWHDALAHDTERLTLAFALSAEAAGTFIANYVRAERLMVEHDAATGVEALDELAGHTFPIRARIVLNAAGPWWQDWIPPLTSRQPLVGAWNILVRRRWFGEIGVGLESTQVHRDAEALVKRGTRNLFFVPWREGTMIGTVYEPFEGNPGDYRPTRRALESFVAEINAVLPGAQLRMDDITLLHIGTQPAPRAPGSPEPDKHSKIYEGPLRGLYAIKGVKYTTGLTVGARAARLIARALGQTARCAEEEALVGAIPLTGSIAEQVRRAVQREHAVRLSDFVLRRSGLGAFSPPDASTCETISHLMAAELKWSDARRIEELELLAAHYRWFTPS